VAAQQLFILAAGGQGSPVSQVYARILTAIFEVFPIFGGKEYGITT